ncbi:MULTISPECIES: SIR2 family protein [Clostridium]|uniref:SIR2 family protein n=1 Tax=Clostridium TaxID=1485 RepID=UPI0004067BB7|nr:MULTISPECIES: SIR2 family protein [Clostridium]MDU1311481.1 SIR2 family protein [Clostridium sp.]MDU1409000.1 SIR2 family protein [Clostridium sp.]
MSDNIKKLRDMLLEGAPILFLGAGFSFGSNIGNGNAILPTDLKAEIKEKLLHIDENHGDIEEINRYNLKEMCELAKDMKGRDELDDFLTTIYSNVYPQEHHFNLIKYPWKKIYTTNIDDLVEKIYIKNKLPIKVQNSAIEKEYDFEGTEYYKLHGCVRNRKEGYTFTDNDYINRIGKTDYRLLEFSFDIQRYNIIFLGTSFEEPDIEYYINLYKNAGYQSRKGKLIFINPKPSAKFKRMIKSLNAELIEWDTKEFLEYLASLNYKPEKIKYLEGKMSYEGFHLLKRIKEIYEQGEYNSELYQGQSTKWEDIFYQWDFVNPLEKQIIEDIKSEKYLIDGTNVQCISMVGQSYIGKTTMLKRLAVDLLNDGYEVIEFKGEEFNIKLLKEYISSISHDKFVLIFDNASQSYPIIEKLLLDRNINKKLFILAASRKYYHNKKKYYLIDDNKSYKEYLISTEVNYEYALNIVNKLDEKGYLGYLRSQRSLDNKIRLLKKEKDLITFMIKLTNGTDFKNSISIESKEALMQDNISKYIIVTLAIFDKLDVDYLPNELLNIIYNTNIDIVQGNNDAICNMLKIDRNGIQIRNGIYTKNILDACGNPFKLKCIYNVLVNIAGKVNENKYNSYRIIFEQLTKEDRLRKDMNFQNEEIKKLYYQIKDWYNNISYYWLQLGLVEQADLEFEKALNHLEQAESIRPDKYQIQHALGRNYLRHANSLNDLSIAEPIFKIGEQRLIKLIEEKEITQPLAYSINCYINEKIKYIDKFNISISKDECMKMFDYIKIMVTKRIDEDNQLDVLVVKRFFDLLKSKKIYGVINFSSGDEFVKEFILKNRIKMV